MRITEFKKTPSSKELNESVSKQFGSKLNLESFSIEQMYDARNKLRTKIHQFESSAGYGAVFEDETYMKNKMFVDVLNAAIAEREATQPQLTAMEQLVLDKVEEGVIAFEDIPSELQEKAKSKAQQKFMGMVYAAKGGEKPASKDVADVAKGMSKKAAHDFAATKHKGKPEHVGESVLREGEEEKAELIMAARDMVDRVTGWMEDTANMQAESMLELIDSIRDELGSDISNQFTGKVKPALDDIYNTLETARTTLAQAVAILTGEEAPGMAPDAMGTEPAAMGADEFPSGDEFAAADASTKASAAQAAAIAAASADASAKASATLASATAAAAAYTDSAVNGVNNSLSDYLEVTERGAMNGVASLDANVKVPQAQLPLNTLTTNINTSGTVSAATVMAEDVTSSGVVTANNVTISGNLTVNGTTTSVNSTSVTIDDPMIYIGDGNQSNSLDLGVVAAFNNGTTNWFRKKQPRSTYCNQSNNL